jgi:hypothetical protein
MENGQKAAQKELPGKKELKKQLAGKMETALPELREMLGEKKFLHRVKKAAKLLMEGLHKKDVQGKKPSASKAATAKKSISKKVTAKKAAAQKAAVKKAPAKTVKKRSTGK